GHMGPHESDVDPLTRPALHRNLDPKAEPPFEEFPPKREFWGRASTALFPHALACTQRGGVRRACRTPTDRRTRRHREPIAGPAPAPFGPWLKGVRLPRRKRTMV